jgi:PhoH-like ATPase
MSATATRRTVVIDTSALIAAGKQPLFAYEGQEIVIPQIVLRELDKLRNDPERGYSARNALRALEALMVDEDGKTAHMLNEPVKMDEKGGTLVVELNHVDESGLPASLKKRNGRDSDYENDVRILAVAFNLMDQDKKNVVLVTNDLSLRVSANSIGIPAEEFANVVPEHGGEFTGIEEHFVAKETIDTLYKEGTVTVGLTLEKDSYFGVNFGVKLTSENSSALATVKSYNKFNNEAVLAVVKNQDAWGMKPRSAEQRFALNHLMNPDIEIVSLGGRAGTGKTALAMAAALEQILENPDCKYEEIVVFRSPHAVGGQELGYLPGDGGEKMAPWADAIFDALKSFVSEEARKEIGERGLIEVLPMTHIRGRSLANAFVIIDEAQNLELPTLMTAVSRIGKNSKVVMTWDITQRDNLRVGRHNGVVAAVNEMAGEEIFAHTTLVRTERSRVAELASRVLEKVQG